MHGESETTRLEAFSDGVFAIAITLLVLEIKLPTHEAVAAHGLMRALAAQWPSYLAYLTSFVTILVFWVQHHWIFNMVRKADHILLYLNGLLLLVVTFIPFPTALMAEYLLHPEGTAAAILYTGNFLAISLVFFRLWRHVSQKGRLLTASTNTLSRHETVQINRNYRLAPLLYLCTFALSFYSEIGGITSCLMLAFFFALRVWPTQRS